MRANEFIIEGMNEHDTILQNLLKMVVKLKKHPEHKANSMSINEFLYTVGVKNNWDTRTHDHPLSQNMRHEAQKFIDAVTHHTRRDTSFNRQDIKQLADTLYQWSEAVRNAPKKPYVEDDYYPREVDDRRTEEELQQFIDAYVEDQLGAPHKGSVKRNMNVIIAVPRNKNRQPGQRWDYEGQRDDWLETSEDIIEELDRAGFGRYELISISPSYIELEKSNLYESTTSGGIAVSMGGPNTMPFGNPSIYDNVGKYIKPAEKKAKTKIKDQKL